MIVCVPRAGPLPVNDGSEATAFLQAWLMKDDITIGFVVLDECHNHNIFCEFIIADIFANIHSIYTGNRHIQNYNCGLKLNNFLSCFPPITGSFNKKIIFLEYILKKVTKLFLFINYEIDGSRKR